MIDQGQERCAKIRCACKSQPTTFYLRPQPSSIPALQKLLPVLMEIKGQQPAALAVMEQGRLMSCLLHFEFAVVFLTEKTLSL